MMNAVEKRYLRDELTLPLVLEAKEKQDICDWGSEHKEELLSLLTDHGGLLLRGFSVKSIADFERFIQVVSSEVLEYKERSSPRSNVQGNIYTSTDYPPHMKIYLHNENSYAHAYPHKICFYCETAAEKGGETPIADVRNVYKRIPEEIRQKFEEKQIKYVRNFSDGVGLSWETVFQTDDPKQVEAYCQEAGYHYEWKDDGGLRIARNGPATIVHPITKEKVWFNHATFFHYSTLDPGVRDALLTIYDVEDLPNNTYYGDGTPIEPEVLDILREAYDKETIKFPWEEGDVLLLDNLVVAHARESFEGKRRVLVGMADMISKK